MIPKMTVKQRIFLKAYLAGKTLCDCDNIAGLKAKGTPALSVIGLRMLRALDIDFQELLDMKGLTDEKMGQVLAEGLQAKKTVVATFEGKICDEKEYDDPPTRAKYLELLGRMKGRFIDRHELSGKDGGDIILSVKPSKPRKEPLTLDIED